MHLVYVADTVDELIYAKADWTDLTGEESNFYWRWGCGEPQPISVATPPRTPLPTEEQAWELLGRRVPTDPTPWPGVPVGQEYSVKTTGAVHNDFGAQIANPQGVDQMVARVRGRAGGRFRVTPEFDLCWCGNPPLSTPPSCLAGLDHPGPTPAQRHLPVPPALDVGGVFAADRDHRLDAIRRAQSPGEGRRHTEAQHRERLGETLAQAGRRAGVGAVELFGQGQQRGLGHLTAHTAAKSLRQTVFHVIP